MFVFYDDETGLVDFTLVGREIPPQVLKPGKSVLEVDMPSDTDFRGWKVIDGDLIHEDIQPLKDQSIAEVNQVIGELRAQYITVIPAQDAIYQVKAEEATYYLSLDPEPTDLSEFLFLSKEVGITAPTAYELAQIWVNLNAYWMGVAADLEQLRISANAQISAATTPTEIEAIMDVFRSNL